ncbi:hypothetical protein NX059_007564 [Plenodomus lindquistii]|nr:hypothetical protein NX059_007564 [Plenodomus lindquistii]
MAPHAMLAIRKRTTRSEALNTTKMPSEAPTSRKEITTRDSTTQTRPLTEDIATPNDETRNGKESARITACIASDPPVSKLAEEAFRLCRVNSYLRRDRKQAQEELRRERASFHSRQAVLEDAIAEMRVDYPETRMILDRAWKLLEERNIRIPPDMKIAYHVLQEPTKHDWQARNGYRVDTSLMKTTPHPKKEKVKTKRSRDKVQKKKEEGNEIQNQTEHEKEKPMNFLLHTSEGRTYDLRNPAEDEYSDDADNESDITMDDSDSDHGDELATDAFGDNAGTTLNVDETTTSPSMPDDASLQDAVGLSANNVIAGVKRKGQEDEGTFQKKPRLEDLDDESAENGTPES